MPLASAKAWRRATAEASLPAQSVIVAWAAAQAMLRWSLHDSSTATSEVAAPRRPAASALRLACSSATVPSASSRSGSGVQTAWITRHACSCTFRFHGNFAIAAST